MHFSHLSNCVSEFADSCDRFANSFYGRFLTWILRIFVGGVFIFSGFVKGIDPWGTFYKFQEYINAFGLNLPYGVILTGVLCLIAFEFIVGICIALGCYRKSAPWLAFILMCFMLPLTLWIALADPVADCGCFGDALILTNWQTFWKNVVLTAAIIWLIKGNKAATGLVTPYLQWLLIVCSLTFIIAVALFGYLVQPMIDFRGYPVGGPLYSNDDTEINAPQFYFIYEKDGEKKRFSESDELPSEEDGWEFVERQEIIAENKTGGADSVRTLRIWDPVEDTDVTSEVLDQEQDQLVVTMPDLRDVSPATTWAINELHRWSEANGAEMYAVVSANSDEISAWSDLAMPSYPIYTSDDTALKEAVRGNPGVIYINGGKIRWKQRLTAIDIQRLWGSTLATAPGLVSNPLTRLKVWAGIYLAALAVLVTASMFIRLRLSQKRRRFQ